MKAKKEIIQVDKAKFERLLKQGATSYKSVSGHWVHLVEADVPIIMADLEKCKVKK